MEEKERYEWNSRFDEAIKDNQTGDIVNAVEVLNKQDKRIKELEKELENYKLCKCVDCSSEYGKGLETSIDELEKENQQLKQQLAITEKALELACEEELREFGVYTEDYGSEQKLFQLIEDYKQQAKEMLENE